MATNNDILFALFVSQNNKTVDGYQGTKVLECLAETSVDCIFEVIQQNYSRLVPVYSNNIPQFSNINDVFKVIQILIDSPESIITWNTIGYYLCGVDAKEGARTKYGENHLKIAVQLGLIDSQHMNDMRVTDLGLSLYLMEDQRERMRILSLLALRVPIIQQALLQAVHGRFNVFNYLQTFLSLSTAIRRRSNIRVLLNLLNNVSSPEFRNLLFNIVWEDAEDDI